MDCLNPQQSNKHKILPIFVNTVNIEGLRGSSTLLRDLPPQKRSLFGPPLRLAHPTQQLPGLFLLRHQQPPQSGINTHFLSKAGPISLAGIGSHFFKRHCHPSPQRVAVIPFFRKAAPVTCAGTRGHLLSRALSAIFFLRQRSCPQQALTAVSRHWHPQHSTGCHLLRWSPLPVSLVPCSPQ